MVGDYKMKALYSHFQIIFPPHTCNTLQKNKEMHMKLSSAQTPQQEEPICLDDSDDEAPSPAKPAAIEAPRRSTRSTRLIGTKELYEVEVCC